MLVGVVGVGDWIVAGWAISIPGKNYGSCKIIIVSIPNKEKLHGWIMLTHI